MADNTEVLIFNQLGMLIHQETTNDSILSIDISDDKFSNGLYLVQAKQATTQTSKRLMITK